MKLLFQLTILLAALFLLVTSAIAQEPVVHALLFYSHTCPHCYKVINEDFPPLMQRYGNQLMILGVDISSEQGSNLYNAAVEYYQIPQERLGVPTLVISDKVLVGSLEIPEKLPGLIEAGLIAGGIDWPGFPEFQKILEAEGYVDSDLPSKSDETGNINQNEAVGQDADPAPEDNIVQSQPVGDEPVVEKTEVASVPDVSQADKIDISEQESIEADPPSRSEIIGVDTDLKVATLTAEKISLLERFTQDIVGNTASVIVLTGMILSVTVVGRRISSTSVVLKTWPVWVVPLLVFIGLFVAIYMSYVEVTETEAVCGPVGDCNTVQQSSYASLFGWIPIGILGILGYLLIGMTWLLAVLGPPKWRKKSILSCWLLCVFGALFSIYLTFLEPFVIGATCAWCLTSAIVMQLLLWATSEPAIRIWKTFRFAGK